MLHFESDYVRGMHPEILQYFAEINEKSLTGYGTDEISERAREKIRNAVGCPEADVFFLSGGTQTNLVVIRSLLRLYEGVIAAETGHINGHEAGAIEAGGHKVLALPHHNGKLDPEDVRGYLAAFYNDRNYSHIVKPGMVYISQPTEYGTLYTLDELKKLRAVCDEYRMKLYLDGARLSYALAADENDVSLNEIAELCDVFYIGGTKVGALFGEAVVFPKPLVEGFFSIVKQSGALLAKGWSAGAQFDAMFTDDLYLRCGKNAIDTAKKLKAGLKAKGYPFFLESPSNQQFVVLDHKKMEELEQKVCFGFWEALDKERTVVRFATSWATTEADIDALLEIL